MALGVLSVINDLMRYQRQKRCQICVNFLPSVSDTLCNARSCLIRFTYSFRKKIFSFRQRDRANFSMNYLVICNVFTDVGGIKL